MDTVSANSGDSQSKEVVLSEFDTPLLYAGDSKFYYKGIYVQKYSLGFYNELDEIFSADNYKLWMSGNGGMKFFTNQQLSYDNKVRVFRNWHQNSETDAAHSRR